MTAEQIHYETLPARIPDLVLQLRNGCWSVREISPNLAKLLKVPQQDFVATPADQLFPQAVPSLPDLAQEIITQKKAISDVRIRLLPGYRKFDLTASVQLEPQPEVSQAAKVQFFSRNSAFSQRKLPRNFRGWWESVQQYSKFSEK